MICKKFSQFLFITLVILAIISFAGAGEKLYKVIKVIDGDTIELENGERVRYIGIDTPETKHPSKPVEYYGKEAAQANARLVEGKGVRLEFDVQRRDKYGRLLAYVYVDTIFVNAWLVEQGYAQILTIPPNVKYQDKFLELQRMAREEGRGLWAKSPEEKLEKASEDTIVYVTKTGKKYHLSNCRYLSKSKIPISLSEAVAGGYTACSVCGAASLKVSSDEKSSQEETPSTSSKYRKKNPDESITVYITKTGSKYHAYGCRYLKKSCIPISLADAKRSGYTPCSVCGGGAR